MKVGVTHLLHRPGPQLGGDARLLLPVVGDVGLGHAEEEGEELALGAAAVGELHLGEHGEGRQGAGQGLQEKEER